MLSGGSKFSRAFKRPLVVTIQAVMGVKDEGGGGVEVFAGVRDHKFPVNSDKHPLTTPAYKSGPK